MRAHGHRGRSLGCLVAGGVVCLAALTPAVASRPWPHRPASARVTSKIPHCFGAAERDPEHQPCVNRRLRLSVVPTPSVAQITPQWPCTPVQIRPKVCSFGTPSSRARATVALVGDSHAWHWRAGVAVIARSKGWHVYSVTRSNCSVSTATPDLSGLPPASRGYGRWACRRWYRDVVGWLRGHPEVRTIIVSHHSRAAGVLVRRGQDEFAARVRGHVRALRSLPASVRHVIVIRDTPYQTTKTFACVERAIARRRPAGRECAVPRGFALRRDAGSVAVERLRSRRFGTVDLTPFMCDAAFCYPVIGGVLVHKDGGHLTTRFAITLGPYLKRATDRLLRRARRP